MGALLVINTVVALLSFFGFGILYWLVIYYTKNQLKGNSICIAEQSTVMIKSLQEGLGGIRDVLIDNSQEFYCKLYQDADAPFRRATGGNIVISGSPRLVMESIGIALIAILAYIMSLQPEGIISTLPVLGALALGAQRLLPALQQVYGSYTTIKGSHSSFLDVLELLDMKLPNFYGKPLPAFIPFAKGIELKGICFRYTEDSPWILKDVNLKINKGMCVGFIGVTGSGKSTLLDIIMGLISPTSGEIFIDGQRIFNENNISWRRHISHVPQHIYLSDNTIEENIAFGKSRGKINHQLVRKAAQKAQISKLIEGWKDGYNTIVGENGVRLSGGQRQRIGIARAFYKQADMLIFDEATSALDNETERDIMKTIDGLENGITILIIAHRLTTLKECDQIIKLDKGKAIHIGGYQDINKDILKK
jgi:ATP-binding cassette subfamily B protein